MKNKIANKSKIKQVCVIILTAVSIFLIASCVRAISIYSDEFNANWNTVVNHIELLCSNEDASFAGNTYRFEPNGGLHTDKDGEKAWILSTEGDPQAAWWHLVDYNSKHSHPNTTLNDNAREYANYRSNFDGIKVSNIQLDSKGNVTFSIKGIGYDKKFVEIDTLEIIGITYSNEKVTKTISTTNPIAKEGKIPAKYINDNNFAKIQIHIKGRHYVAESSWQNYKATKIKTNKGWEDITSGAQPLTVFTGERYWKEDESKTSLIWTRTKVSIDKYITQINGVNITNQDVDNNYTVRENKSQKDKEDNKVIAEPGDIITYKIKVKNETQLDQNVTLEEKTSKNLTNRSWTSKKIKLNAGETKELIVKAQIDGQDESWYNNHVYISGTSGINMSENKKEDYDYARVKKYKVSLEKYVSGVASGNKNGNNLISDVNSSTYNTNLTDRSNNQVYINNNKSNNKVQVEVGDTITYTIKIRNTGTDTKNWGNIYIYNITDSINNYFTNISCSNGVSYYGGNFSLNTMIPVGEVFEFNVTGTLTSIPKSITNQNIEIINTATINKIFNRNTYDVKDRDGAINNSDRDWIVTKTYAVSLRKYVSNVSSEQNSGEINTSAWENLKDYIGTDINKYEELKSKVEKIKREDILASINKSNSEYDLSDYLKYDLNNDGKVTQEDYNLYLKEKATNGKNADEVKELIQDFINSDLNKDNKVDDTDLELFIKTMADVNRNGECEETDLYEWNLLNTKYLNKLDSEYLQKIKIAIIKRELKLSNKEDVNSAIEHYIKSDVNEDGVVDKSDDISYYKNNNDVTEQDINNFIKENDINLDKNVNSTDIEIEKGLENSKNNLVKYDEIKEYANANINIYDENGNLLDDYKDYDVINDGTIDINDYIKLLKNSNDEETKAKLRKLSKLPVINIELIKYDYNLDKKIDEEDYKEALKLANNDLKEQGVVYLSYLKENVTSNQVEQEEKDENNENNQNNETDKSDENLEEKGTTINIDLDIEKYQELRNFLLIQSELKKKQYDLNNDGFISKADTEVESVDFQTKDAINQILNMAKEKIEEDEIKIKINIKDYMDLDADGKITTSDMNLLNYYTSCPDEIWNKIKNETKLSLDNEKIKYYDLNNDETVSNIDIKIYNILIMDSYDELLETLKKISESNIEINTTDKTEHENYLNSINNKIESNEELTYYAINKLDEEGKLNIYYETLKNKEKDRKDGDETDIAFDVNKNGKYSDEIERVEEYIKIKNNEKALNEFEYLDLDFDGKVDTSDYNICKVIANKKEYDASMLDKLELYDINSNGKVEKDDIEAVDKLYSEVSNEENIATIDYYNYVKDNMNRENFEFKRADITQDYLLNGEIKIDSTDRDKLNGYMTQYKNTYLSETYEIEKTSIDKINKLKNNSINLDLNNDGKVDEKDIEIVSNDNSDTVNIEDLNEEKFEKYKNTNISEIDVNGDGKIDKADLEIINNNSKYDLNADNKIDEIDLKLYDQVQAAKNNQTMDNDIKRYCNNENAKADKWEGDRSGYKTIYEDGNYKSNRPVTIEQGDYVTYTIKLTNDGNTSIYFTNILDDLPEGYVTYNGERLNEINRSDLAGTLVEPGQSVSIFVTVKVTEPNSCIDLIENIAEIKEIKNRNYIPVEDTSTGNNRDADYIQLRDIDITGNIWNDKALTKDEVYNGLKDEEEKDIPKDVKVTLYRILDENGNQTEELATEIISSETGKYTFTSRGKNPNIKTTKIKERYYTTDSYFRWTTYCSYYVVFTYDGVTYTSTPDGTTCKKIDDKESFINKNYIKNSNACEDNVNGFKNAKKRAEFNNNFAKIGSGIAKDANDKKTMNISYTTKNEEEFIPQSNHVYNANTMAMQSSTDLIKMRCDNNLEEQLRYVNLGLRGKDIFDLKLTSNVSKVKVKVNNKVGVYNYTNKINIRNTDIGQGEDMANVESETSTQYLYDSKENEVKQDQALRDMDLNTSSIYTGTNVEDYNSEQGIQDIQVTYKVTVANASQTDGMATIVNNYYDKAYGAIEGNINACIEINGKKSLKVKVTNLSGSEKYNVIQFNVKEGLEELLGNSNMLTQSQSYDLYFTLTMTDEAKTKIKSYIKSANGIKSGELKYPTYNLAEIYEYTTKVGIGQTEYTRGLLDKNSAPGSVQTEKVRLAPNEEGSSSTAEYYFKGENLKKLKYEDDTCTTPTLYFVSQNTTDSGKGRKISGTVFEDYTAIIDNNDGSEIRTKTGDGIQTGDEPGIEGVTVELLEKVDNTYKIRYTTKTDKDGNFEFNNFLPGDYKIRYTFGKINETFLYSNGLNVNTKSYNGEDFQSTNNTGKIGNEASKREYETATGETIILNKIDETAKFWYAINKNEGISTAVEDSDRRKYISNIVSAFSDDEMSVLNNARDGKSESECTEPKGNVEGKTQIKAESIAQKTYISSDTKDMELTTEETVDISKIEDAEKLIQDGKIVQKENGVGEWAIFPNSNEIYKEYHISNMNFGIAEVPVTTLDLQKHVKKFKITDSTGNNTIAEVEAKNESQVTVNPSKVAANKIDIVINVLSKDLGMEKEIIKNLIGYSNKSDKQEDSNKIITASATATQVKKLQYDMTMYSLAREITITRTWNIKAGNVLAAPGIDVLDVSIEDEKLQGAKLKVTYDITSSIYAEKNFNNDAVTVPSIKGIADYVDNNLSYNEDLENNKEKWTVSTYEDIIDAYDKQAEYESKLSNSVKDTRKGTLDTTTNGTKYTTIVEAIDNNVLLETCGTGSTEITLEKILSSTDSSISDIVTSSIDTYEYGNSLEITGIDYKNATGETTGDFIFRDRVRTADRYIVLAGRQHDTATAETIAIHPPTGKNNNINYYIVALVSLTLLAGGIIAIKKKVLKNNRK